MAFCNWLSEKKGLTYRLPTEAEWEYACRAGTTTAYQTGDSPAELAKMGRFADGTFTTKAAPVGSFRANGFGLHDMHGNVEEWCYDWYARGTYEDSPLRHPTGPASGSVRVHRGGSWAGPANLSRSALRNWYFPSSRSTVLGFRVAASLPVQ